MGGRQRNFRDIHAELKSTFIAEGWVCDHAFVPANDDATGYVADTSFGPVRIEHDGELTLTNPALHHV